MSSVGYYLTCESELKEEARYYKECGFLQEAKSKYKKARELRKEIDRLIKVEQK